MSAEWAFVLGMTVGVAVSFGWLLLGRMHRHKWTPYRHVKIVDSSDRTFAVDGQVRNCRVCNREQVRQ